MTCPDICPCRERAKAARRQVRAAVAIFLVLAAVLLFAPALVPDTQPERVVVEQIHHGQPDAKRTTPPSDALLACIRHYESRGDYHAVSRSGKYRGAYQFNRQTWNGVAQRTIHSDWYGADPANAPVDIQDSFASQLYRERGLQPWPTPSRKCRGK